MPFKTFNSGDVLTASDVNTYLMKQSVITCTSGTRPSSPVEGMVIYETDTDRLVVYNGTTWVPQAYTAGATVATLQTTTSTSYTDLATSGPAATLVTGTVAIVHLACAIFNSGGVLAAMSFAVSGATTQAASDANALIIQNASLHRYGVPVRVTGLTAGSNTFTAKYRVAGSTGSFQDRHLFVTPG